MSVFTLTLKSFVLQFIYQFVDYDWFVEAKMRVKISSRLNTLFIFFYDSFLTAPSTKLSVLMFFFKKQVKNKLVLEWSISLWFQKFRSIGCQYFYQEKHLRDFVWICFHWCKIIQKNHMTDTTFFCNTCNTRENPVKSCFVFQICRAKHIVWQVAINCSRVSLFWDYFQSCVKKIFGRTLATYYHRYLQGETGF